MRTLILLSVMLCGCATNQAPRVPDSFTCVRLANYPGERGNDGKWSYRYNCDGKHQLIKIG